MPNNQYLSRYSKFDTHFQRTDPWRNTPFDFQLESKTELIVKETIGAICFIAILIGLMFLN